MNYLGVDYIKVPARPGDEDYGGSCEGCAFDEKPLCEKSYDALGQCTRHYNGIPIIFIPSLVNNF